LPIENPADSSIHVHRYYQAIKNNLVTTDPPNRQRIEDELTELKDRDEEKFNINDQGSFCSTLRERSVTNLSSRAAIADFTYETRLKSRDFFRNKLQAQNIVKHLQLVACCITLGEPRAVFSTNTYQRNSQFLHSFS
jgi:hypothetical protein